MNFKSLRHPWFINLLDSPFNYTPLLKYLTEAIKTEILASDDIIVPSVRFPLQKNWKYLSSPKHIGSLFDTKIHILFLHCPNSYSSSLVMRPAHSAPEKLCSNCRSTSLSRWPPHLSRLGPLLHCFLFKSSLPQTAELVFLLSISVPSWLWVLLCLSEADTRIKGRKKSQQKAFSRLQ